MREYLISKGIPEAAAVDFTNRVVEGGKHPERQAYNKNGILVTFPTPQHKQNAIRRGTHFEKDPTKGHPNLFTDPQGRPKRGPGRPKKDDNEKDTGEFTPPSQGGGKSIDSTGDVSSLPVSGDDTQQSPSAADTDTTSAAPAPDGEADVAEPAQSGPPDVLPAKPPKEKAQDKRAIQQMMISKGTALGSPLETPPPDNSKENDQDAINVAKLYMNEVIRVLDRLSKK
jgi:hypothetical protein